MRSILSASLIIAAVTAGGAYAADMYEPRGSLKDGPVYIPVTSWTGFYAGVNVGYGWNANSSDIDYDVLVVDAPFTDRSRGADPSGAFGGAQIGYNIQRGNLVYGIEADIQGSDINDTASAISLVNLVPGTVHQSLDWFGTLRGRLGVAYDSALLYVTGGLAFGRTDDRITALVSLTPFTLEREDTKAGFAVGGGIEYAFSPAWSLKAEYLYIDLGSDRLSGTPTVDGIPADGVTATTSSIDHTFHTVRIGLNYHLHQEYEPLK